MDKNIEQIILTNTKANLITKTKDIQTLWSGYGKIVRCFLNGSMHESIVVKHIKLPKASNHPRGWNTNLSHQRKLKSYIVEMEFYKTWSKKCNDFCYVPDIIAIQNLNEEAIIVLEDLDNSGYSARKTNVTLSDMKLCLAWLANFHACFMGQKPDGLWNVGTYWHLETRPDELKEIDDIPLKNAAYLIDSTLNNCKYQSFVHGDAKLANFCFFPDGEKVAAVDFQYVGGGCGMKDVAYFIGSCLYEDDCEKFEKELLDYYFDELKIALESLGNNDFDKIEQEWRKLFPYAWTDFHRFIKGWSPGHWKINSYSEKISKTVINSLIDII